MASAMGSWWVTTDPLMYCRIRPVTSKSAEEEAEEIQEQILWTIVNIKYISMGTEKWKINNRTGVKKNALLTSLGRLWATEKLSPWAVQEGRTVAIVQRAQVFGHRVRACWETHVIKTAKAFQKTQLEVKKSSGFMWNIIVLEVIFMHLKAPQGTSCGWASQTSCWRAERQRISRRLLNSFDLQPPQP